MKGIAIEKLKEIELRANIEVGSMVVFTDGIFHYNNLSTEDQRLYDYLTNRGWLKMIDNSTLVKITMSGYTVIEYEPVQPSQIGNIIISDINSSNLSIGSSSVNQNVSISQVVQSDPQIKALLEELQNALPQKNDSLTKKILNQLIDKGISLGVEYLPTLLALIATTIKTVTQV